MMPRRSRKAIADASRAAIWCMMRGVISVAATGGGSVLVLVLGLVLGFVLVLVLAPGRHARRNDLRSPDTMSSVPGRSAVARAAMRLEST